MRRAGDDKRDTRHPLRRRPTMAAIQLRRGDHRNNCAGKRGCHLFGKGPVTAGTRGRSTRSR